MRLSKWLLLVGILLLSNGLSKAAPAYFACANDWVNLDDFTAKNSIGTAYSWVNSNINIGLKGIGAGKIPPFKALNDTDEDRVATFLYITTNPNGSAQTTEFTLTVRPKPRVLLPVFDLTFCHGVPFRQSLTGLLKGTTLSFTSDNPSVNLATKRTTYGVDFIALNASNAPKIAQIEVTPTLNGCIGTPQSLCVTVVPTPSVNPLPDTIVCAGDDLSLDFSGTLPETIFDWVSDNPAVGLPPHGSGSLYAKTVNQTGENQRTILTVTPRLYGCAGPPKSFVIVVKPAPVLTINTFNFCANEKAHIEFETNLLTPTTTHFKWINNAPKGHIPPKGNTNIIDFDAASNTINQVVTTYLTVLTTASGCRAATQVTVNVKPLPMLFNPGNLLAVAGENVRLHFDSSLEGTTVEWTNTQAAIGLPRTGSGDLNFRAGPNNLKAPIVAQIMATPVLDGCSEQPQMFSITVQPTPSVSTPLATIPNQKDGEISRKRDN